MFNLANHPLKIGTGNPGDWFKPVLDRGRGAAFVDTGFIRALIDERDKYHTRAIRHFEQALDTNYYTTSLVLAEAIRQVAKTDRINYSMRAQWFDSCTKMMITTSRVYVCVPSREVLMEAYSELAVMRQSIPDLDLCDALSMSVLNHAEHKRVFGFDGHFSTFGASLEP